MIYQIRFFIGQKLGLLASIFSRLFSRGSGEQIQGRIVDLICPRALKKNAANKRIIVISSTNGKTTTARLITNALESKYSSVISNALGANQRAGIVSALVNTKHISRSNEQIAVLEVDERSLPGMFDELNPELVVFGNLSRDQLDRFGEVSSISHSWKKMLVGARTHIIANGCDPHIVFAVKDLPVEQVRYVDIKSKWHDDAYSCPVCGDLLVWNDQSHFESKSCGFRTPKDTVDIEDNLKNKISSSLNLPGNWNLNNAYLAFHVCKHLDIDDSDIIERFSEVSEVEGRNAVFQLDDDRTIQLFLAKNPAGWNETLSHISIQPADSTIFAFNCNIADGKDPSWLYDVDFEGANINDIVVFGQRSIDLNTRLTVAGKNVYQVKDLKEALAHTAFATHTNLVASYTQFLALSRVLPKIAFNNEEIS